MLFIQVTNAIEMLKYVISMTGSDKGKEMLILAGSLWKEMVSCRGVEQRVWCHNALYCNTISKIYQHC